MTIFSPFIFTFLLFVFWIFYKIKENLPFPVMIEHFCITTAISFLFFLSPIINVLADFLDSTEIFGNYYITSYLIERSNNNPQYNLWRNYLILPSFCFFTILFPLCLFIYMQRRKHILFTEGIIYKIGFVLNGYSSETFYWYFNNITCLI